MDWTRGRTIGHGSSATVSVAISHESGELFAVKSANFSQSQFLRAEQQILSTLSCDQIVSYKGCNISTENGSVLYNLFLEYAPRGTLSDEIRRQGGCLNEAAIRSYTKQILLGLLYLHSNGIAHCDIKCHNILVTDNEVKLADLGCARRVHYDHGLPIGGTPLYMAPEVARGEQQGLAADVWALGCILIEMATGRHPWPDVSDPVSALYRIAFSGDVPEIPSSLSKQGRDFVSKCLRRDPLERWSASELLKHDFFLEEPNCLFSPTTVLDHGLWEDSDHLAEGFEFDLEEPTHANSAKERIQQLSEGNATLFSGVPNWACDEDWVTVRSNDIGRPDITDDEAANTSSGLGLETCNAASFRRRHRKISSSRQTRHRNKCSPLMASKRNEYVFCANLIFGNKELWFFFHCIIFLCNSEKFSCITIASPNFKICTITKIDMLRKISAGIYEARDTPKHV